MNLMRFGAVCLFILALLLPLASGFSALPLAADAAGEPPPQSGGTEDHNPLFPGLRRSMIAAVSVKTPDSSFEFRCSPADRVSVNGHMADKEIFSTLISQILALPVRDARAFSRADAPLLTLVVSTTDGADHTARFYGGGGMQADVASGPAESPAYHQTDAWRVGTLIMTCEGTRIQDEHGNETPAD